MTTAYNIIVVLINFTKLNLLITIIHLVTDLSSSKNNTLIVLEFPWRFILVFINFLWVVVLGNLRWCDWCTPSPLNQGIKGFSFLDFNGVVVHLQGSETAAWYNITIGLQYLVCLIALPCCGFNASTKDFLVKIDFSILLLIITPIMPTILAKWWNTPLLSQEGCISIDPMEGEDVFGCKSINAWTSFYTICQSDGISPSSPKRDVEVLALWRKKRSLAVRLLMRERCSIQSPKRQWTVGGFHVLSDSLIYNPNIKLILVGQGSIIL